MIHPTDITREALIADLKANGPSLIKDITCRVLGLPLSAARGVTVTHRKHYIRVYSLFRTLVKHGIVATRMSDAFRDKQERRGEYYIPGQDEPGSDVTVPERKVAGATDITRDAIIADLKANGPSLMKDITRRVLGLPPSAARGVTVTHNDQYENVYRLLRTLMRNEIVAKDQRRGLYYIPDQGEPGLAVPAPERKAASGPNTVVSSGGVFATREDGTVFRFAPVSGDPNGEWRWQRLPDLPRD